jgi:hypothetical protein
MQNICSVPRDGGRFCLSAALFYSFDQTGGQWTSSVVTQAVQYERHRGMLEAGPFTCRSAVRSRDSHWRLVASLYHHPPVVELFFRLIAGSAGCPTAVTAGEFVEASPAAG